MPDDKKGSNYPTGRGAAWAAPLVRVDAAWQALESRMCATILVAEIASLTLWIVLRGLATDHVPGGNAAGLLCRAILSAGALGGVAHVASRKRGQGAHRIAVSGAILLGFLAAGSWAHVGVQFASNYLNWLQNASALMLIGGLRGLATRLTLWLALVGASLATSRGKHIHVDVVVRYLPEKLRMPSAVAGWLAAAAVCVVGVVGFIDYISIAEFRASATKACPGEANTTCDAPASEKLATMGRAMSADVFMLGRQASLDLKSLPHVLAGTPYDKWMTAAEWNAWLDDADWAAHFDKGAVDALHMDPSAPTATRMPQVVVPGTGEDVRALLIRDFNLVFPLGLGIIAIKFLIRVLLVLSGHIEIHPEAELDDDELKHAHERDDAAARGMAT
jgi:hypothetical protein